MASWLAGAWGAVEGAVVATISTATPNTLAVASFATLTLLTIGRQRLRPKPAPPSLADKKLDEYNERGRPDELKTTRPSQYTHNSILPGAGSSLLGSSPGNSGSQLDSLGSPAARPEPTKNFFQFRPPTRSLPNPERYLKPSSPSSDSQRLSPSNIAAHNGSSSAEDQRASLGSPGAASALTPSPSAARAAAFDGETESMSGETVYSFDGNPSEVRRPLLLPSLSLWTLVTSIPPSPPPSPTFPFPQFGGGVKFVTDSDSEDDDDASRASGRQTPLDTASQASQAVAWRPQFILTVPKWEYTETGDVLFTVLVAYTPSSSWTVRRTYAQFCAWRASVERELAACSPPLVSAWPTVEFVLFYMPVEAIEARMALLSSYMHEVSNTENLVRAPPVFRSLLAFVDPGPHDDHIQEDMRHATEIGRNGEDIKM